MQQPMDSPLCVRSVDTALTSYSTVHQMSLTMPVCLLKPIQFLVVLIWLRRQQGHRRL